MADPRQKVRKWLETEECWFEGEINTDLDFGADEVLEFSDNSINKRMLPKKQ